jgi:NADH-quinone oxidoreductase subunit H
VETFEQFLVRVLLILFWVLVIVPVFAFPIIAIAFPGPIHILGQELPNIWAFVANPIAIIDLQNNLLGCILNPIRQALFPTEPILCTGGAASSPELIPGLGVTFLDFFKISTFPGFTFAAIIATVMILVERKFLAKVNLRIGPLYAGRFEGILQPIADLFKLLFKEIIIPRRADKLMFVVAPLLTFSVAAALLAVIPVSPDWIIAPSSLGLLIAFAVVGFFPLLVLIAAWASSNKFSLVGGLRALHQLISFEIPLVLSVIGVVILAQSMDLIKIVEAQAQVWFIAPQIVGAAVFYIAMLAELERIPFDMPEADSEIVMGWLTEYSGMLFGLPAIAIYIKFYALSALFTTLFLGGWMGPSGVPPEVWFVLKTLVVMLFAMVVRGANPRIRIDMLIRLGWQWLILLSLANIFIAVALAQAGVFA